MRGEREAAARPSLARSVLLPQWSTGWLTIAAGAIAFVALVHLSTLDRFPLPWLDDTSFSSIVDAYVRTGRLDFPVAPTWFDEPMYLYGPMYFVAAGSLFRWFGESVFVARLPCLLFGLALLPVLFLILRQKTVHPALAWVACLLLATDPIYTRQLHSGRMDTMALFFLLLSFFCLIRSDGRSLPGLAWCAASGMLAALGLLTTPRPGYLVPVMGVILLKRAWFERTPASIVAIVVWSTIILGSYLMWLLPTFGSIEHALKYYAFFRESSAGLGYVWPSQVPLLLGLLALVVLAARTRPALLADETVIFSIFGIACFYVFVKDGPPYFGGTYSIFMRPLAYLAMAVLASGTLLSIPARYGQLGVGLALTTLLTAYASVFFGWSALIALQWSARNPARASDFVAATIPAGSKVVGDESFYFAARSSGSCFQYHVGVDVPIQRARKPLADRVAYQRDAFGAQYLVTAMGSRSPVFQEYARQFDLVKLVKMNPPEEGPLVRAILSAAAAFGWRPDIGYTATIYARGGPPGPIVGPDPACERHDRDERDLVSTHRGMTP